MEITRDELKQIIKEVVQEGFDEFKKDVAEVLIAVHQIYKK